MFGNVRVAATPGVSHVACIANPELVFGSESLSDHAARIQS